MAEEATAQEEVIAIHVPAGDTEQVEAAVEAEREAEALAVDLEVQAADQDEPEDRECRHRDIMEDRECHHHQDIMEDRECRRHRQDIIEDIMVDMAEDAEPVAVLHYLQRLLYLL